MGTELKHGKITQNMKDNSNKGKNVEKENIIGKKISTMKENFWMIN